MKYAIDNRLQHFDFMGAGNPNQPYGVRDYKEKFGGKLVEHGRYRKITKPFLFILGKISLKIISRF
jgi:lipid II:glycine glycyltransferase (peptidoglycan interpeptide bridge formation enzyme)